jgi:hypothetical protein
VAWRSPRFAHHHALLEAGVSALSFANAVDADKPADFLLDNRAASLFGFATAESDHYIQVDRGAGTLAVLERVWIPSGHNIAGNTIRIRSADDAAMSVSVANILGGTAVPAGAFDADLTGSTAQRQKRYVRLEFTSGTVAWELGELLLTVTEELSIGIEQRWGDEPNHNHLVFPKESGIEAALELGPSRRGFEFTWRAVPAADRAILEALDAAVGRSRPFLLDPPYDSEPAVWVKQERDLEGREETELPAETVPDRVWRYRMRALGHLA